LIGSFSRPSAAGHFYALSEVLTVVPEPSSAAMVLFFITMGFGTFRRIAFSCLDLHDP
jgi:hypothetical protein